MRDFRRSCSSSRRGNASSPSPSRNRSMNSAPLATELFHHPDLGSSDLVVVTRDVPGRFALIAGTLAAHGV